MNIHEQQWATLQCYWEGPCASKLPITFNYGLQPSRPPQILKERGREGGGREGWGEGEREEHSPKISPLLANSVTRYRNWFVSITCTENKMAAQHLTPSLLPPHHTGQQL